MQIDPLIKRKKRSGGARKGAGRKAVDGAKGIVVVSISITPDHKEKLKALGGSAWIRAKIDGDFLPA